VIAPLQILVADDFGLSANHKLGAAVALRKAAAELVDRRFRIDAHDFRIAAHVCARVDAVRPSRQVVVLQRFPESGADIGGRHDLGDCDTALHANAPQVGSKCLTLAHGNDRRSQDRYQPFQCTQWRMNATFTLLRVPFFNRRLRFGGPVRRSSRDQSNSRFGAV
jgi:hypothetical protein